MFYCLKTSICSAFSGFKKKVEKTLKKGLLFPEIGVIISKLSREPEGEGKQRHYTTASPIKGGRPRKKFQKNLKKGLTNEKRCGKIVKHSREKRKHESRESKAASGFERTQRVRNRTLKIKQREERRTREFLKSETQQEGTGNRT